MRMTFLGAAGTVTGSKYLLEHRDLHVLIDCGLFQGYKQLRLHNWDTFQLPVQDLHAIVLTHALSIINWSADVPANAVKVIVQNGWITLEGQVDWQYQKETVEKAVRKLSGVLGVDNRLTLSPRVDIVDIRKRIEDALKRNAEVDAKDIHVRVDGDVVRLDGKVHLWRERKLVERAAWSVPGVTRVEDHLLLA